MGARVPIIVFVTGDNVKMLNRPKPLVLFILDGFGYSLEEAVDANLNLQRILDILGSVVGSLSDLASTMLDTLGIPQPAEMMGRSLLATH